MTSRAVTAVTPHGFVLLVAIALGVFVRLVPALPGPLTPGDGGLIVVMVDDLRDAGLMLPEVTTYNGADIPFVYPPLALYATALLADLVGLTSLDGVRIMATLLSLATLAMFAVLARHLMPPVAAVAAVVMYALMPHAYDPLVAGGGVTRATGLLLAMAALAVAATPALATPRRAAALGVLLGLTALSHPQTALYAAAASTVLVVHGAGSRRGATAALRVAEMGVVAVAVIIPWLALMPAQEGLGSVLAAGNRWDPVLGIIRLLGLTFSGSTFADLFLVVGVLGLAVELLRRRWLLPLLLGCLIFSGEADFIAAVPWSLLGGAGIAFVLEGVGPLANPGDRGLRVSVALVALFAALVSSLGSVVNDTSRLQRVSADQVQAMHWVAAETDANTRFIVATTAFWGGDETSEWFPAVAERQSVATVQGSEWLGADSYRAQLGRHQSVVACTRSTDLCFVEWAATEGFEDAWLFIPKGQVNGPLSANDCCPALRELVRAGGHYEVLYDSAGATVARPIPRVED